jgi:hypothetical protein
MSQNQIQLNKLSCHAVNLMTASGGHGKSLVLNEVAGSIILPDLGGPGYQSTACLSPPDGSFHPEYVLNGIDSAIPLLIGESND